ncbi:MAG: hypothetical protein EBT03_09530, partial [Betaproteobacteria bacterium]|nr:hypothetical protein [Betaproteobacteria bacterium]
DWLRKDRGVGREYKSQQAARALLDVLLRNSKSQEIPLSSIDTGAPQVGLYFIRRLSKDIPYYIEKMSLLDHRISVEMWWDEDGQLNLVCPRCGLMAHIGYNEQSRLEEWGKAFSEACFLPKGSKYDEEWSAEEFLSIRNKEEKDVEIPTELPDRPKAREDVQREVRRGEVLLRESEPRQHGDEEPLVGVGTVEQCGTCGADLGDDSISSETEETQGFVPYGDFRFCNRDCLADAMKGLNL